MNLRGNSIGTDGRQQQRTMTTTTATTHYKSLLLCDDYLFFLSAFFLGLYQSKTALPYSFFDDCFFLSRHQYTIKPRHIRHLLGAYIPNDEDVSLLEQIAADKGRFSDQSDCPQYGSANYVDYLRRLVPEKNNQL